ncbi:unnamed protein product, partial [Adineta ricciae]
MNQMVLDTFDRHIGLNEHRTAADILMDDNSKLSSSAPLAKVLYKTKQDNRLTILKFLQELKRFVYATRRETVRTFLFSMILCIMTAIGIIIVCLTAPKPKVSTCGLNFVRTRTNPIEYNYGPVSVAIGDFNLDTWIDMVIVNSIVSRIGVYFGNAKGTFVKEYEYSTGINSSPTMAVVDDLNNDSYLDIAVTNYNTHSIGIFYGFGNGSFREQIEISTGISRPLSLHLVDFNNDTFVDIIVINHGTNSISIFYGDRKGNFVNLF